MNTDQARIACDILNDVEKGKKKNPLIKFICGAGGVGKSELIKYLISQIGIYSVIVCAPTAIAALSIGGRSIHSVFKLDPSSDKKDNEKLPPHKFLKLLIIDEISMCSSSLFQRVERRMKQLMSEDVYPFGGCTVAVFGDLLQIPPVNGEWVFKCIISEKVEIFMKSSSALLWQKHMQFDELEVSMRQRNDEAFGSKLRRWRCGIYNRDDEEYLEGRYSYEQVEDRFFRIHKRGQLDVVLIHSNKGTAIYNEKITKRLFDKSQLSVIGQVFYLKNKNGDPNSIIKREYGFEVGTGSQVIVTKNVDKVFLNGMIGIVERLETESNYVEKIYIKFPNGEVHSMNPIETVITPAMIRTDFPLAPAFALTYHKAQGQTLDNVFLSTYEELPPSLFYVGASRVRLVSNLHMISPRGCRSLSVEPEALAEYKRLRTSAGKTPLP